MQSTTGLMAPRPRCGYISASSVFIDDFMRHFAEQAADAVGVELGFGEAAGIRRGLLWGMTLLMTWRTILRLGYHAIVAKSGIPTAKIDPNFQRSPLGRPFFKHQASCF